MRILQKLGIEPGVIRVEVERQVTHGDGRLGQDMQLTPRAKRVIDLAYDEARMLNNNYIGTKHLLLGMLREGEGLAGRVLSNLGLELDTLRKEISSVQESNADSTTPSEPPLRFDANKLPEYSRIRRETAEIIPRVVTAANRLGTDVGLEHYVLAMLMDSNLNATKALAKLGVTAENFEQTLKDLASDPETGAEA